MKREWSKLPSDLLQSIADLLLAVGAVDDYIRFRAVCVAWRSATIDPRYSEKPQLPWLMLTFDELSTEPRSFYRLSDDKVLTFHLPEVLGFRIVGSSDGWLLLVHKSSAVRLFNPLTGSRIDLPPLTAIPSIVKHDEDNFGKEYTIKGGLRGILSTHQRSSKDVRDLQVQKVITATVPNSMMMMVFMIVPGVYGGGLVFARVGVDDKSTEVDQCTHCEDMLFHRGLLYVVDEHEKSAAVDVGPPAKVTSVLAVTVESQRDSLLPRWSLVEIDGNLSIVVRYLHFRSTISVKRTQSVGVFRVDNAQGGEWKLTKVNNLGD